MNVFEKTVRQKAVFGEITFDLTDRWSVTGGARWFEYDRHEFESDEVPKGLPVFDEDSPDSGNFVLAEPTASEGTDDDVVMKFATQYKFDDSKMLYALYSEGFRLGGKNSARAALSGAVPETYKPDTMENYELGFKSQWLDNRLLLNVSAFFMEWSDIQLSGDTSPIDPWWVRGTFNGGKAEQKGIELQTEWRVSDRFSLELGGFMADPEFSEGFDHARRRSRRRRLADAGLSGGKIVGRGRIPRARFPDPGRRVLDPAVVQLPGGVLEQPHGDPVLQQLGNHQLRGCGRPSSGDVDDLNDAWIRSSRPIPPVRCSSACRATTAGTPH